MYKYILLICIFCVNLGCVTNKVIEDKWENITSIEEILGNWEGTLFFRFRYILTELPMTFTCSKTEEKNYVTDMYCDFNPLVDKLVNDTKINKKIDVSKDEIFGNMGVENISKENYEIISGKFFQRMITTYPNEDHDRRFEYKYYLINQHGNKLKLLNPETGNVAAIMYKK
jgi:hypothetical protein